MRPGAGPAENRGRLSYLPPPTTRGLVRQKILLVGGCLLEILLLGVFFLTV